MSLGPAKPEMGYVKAHPALALFVHAPPTFITHSLLEHLCEYYLGFLI